MSALAFDAWLYESAFGAMMFSAGCAFQLWYERRSVSDAVRFFCIMSAGAFLLSLVIRVLAHLVLP